MSLFRKEALSSFESRFIGRPLVARSIPVIVIAYLSILMVIVIIIFFYFGSYTKKIQVSGVVMPKGEVVRVYNNYEGIIDAVHVREGDFVKKGDLLFTIVNDRVSNLNNIQKESVDLIESKIKISKDSIENLRFLQSKKTSLLQNKIISLRNELEITEGARQLLNEKLIISEANLVKYKKLRERNMISPSQFDMIKLDNIEAEIKTNDILSRKNRLVSEIKELQLTMMDLPLEIKKERHELEQELMELSMRLNYARLDRENQVLSPVDGTISSLNAFNGKNINRSYLLAVLVPEDVILEGVLRIPNRAIGFIKNGDVVRMRLDAFPYQKFGAIHGHVEHISTVALLPYEMPDVMNNKDMLYAVRVRLDDVAITAYGKRLPLKPSMTFTADVMMEKRRIYEWILEPLYSITGRI